VIAASGDDAALLSFDSPSYRHADPKKQRQRRLPGAGNTSERNDAIFRAFAAVDRTDSPFTFSHDAREFSRIEEAAQTPAL